MHDGVSFRGATRVEVITVLANCGRDTDKARRALVTWIRHKQERGRNTQHILDKLQAIESKFIRDTSLHSAFRDARAETFLPRAPDLPLPAFIKRQSDYRPTESVVSPINSGPSPTASRSTDHHPGSIRRPSPSIRSSRLSIDSSQISEAVPPVPTPNQRASLPRGTPPAPSPSSRIQIPRNQSMRSTPSSAEDSALHLRQRYISDPLGSSSRSLGLSSSASVAPGNRSPPSTSPRDRYPERHLSPRTALLPPPIQIPHPRSVRSMRNSPRSSSSEDSELRLRYLPMSHSMGPSSPGLRLRTPPERSPPEIPLPPIPSDDSNPDRHSGTSILFAEQPPTPVRNATLPPPTPVRPLPIPSPVPGSDESEQTDSTGGDSLRRGWYGSNGCLPSDDVVREDSPVYAFQDDCSTHSGLSPPPPYVDLLDSYCPPETPALSDALERAISVCGGSQEVRNEVCKCVGFDRGYEPPYWQTRLQACGLNAEAARYLVDEMSKQVDWTLSYGRAI